MVCELAVWALVKALTRDHVQEVQAIRALCAASWRINALVADAVALFALKLRICIFTRWTLGDTCIALFALVEIFVGLIK